MKPRTNSLLKYSLLFFTLSQLLSCRPEAVSTLHSVNDHDMTNHSSLVSKAYKGSRVVKAKGKKGWKDWSEKSTWKGGKTPENNSHLVIDKPESVNLVKPPITIINATRQNIKRSQV